MPSTPSNWRRYCLYRTTSKSNKATDRIPLTTLPRAPYSPGLRHRIIDAAHAAPPGGRRQAGRDRSGTRVLLERNPREGLPGALVTAIHTRVLPLGVLQALRGAPPVSSPEDSQAAVYVQIPGQSRAAPTPAVVAYGVFATPHDVARLLLSDRSTV